MAVTIVGNNTPTAGGVVYGDGTNYASTAAGTSGQALLSNGSSAPTWGSASSAAVTEYTSSATWTKPTCTFVMVECWGGGGGAGCVRVYVW